eukprot:TRINITY_DN21496_c0_g1_i2.p1 TRINITY_DN21496_c0_g1~~TRINITY_DN21496_c0_g1_i2.p1  ORF type:complete len:380 (+),score=13.53 TRINITY_DN21496_c0_g1_i2:599-1738(+)
MPNVQALVQNTRCRGMCKKIKLNNVEANLNTICSVLQSARSGRRQKIRQKLLTHSHDSDFSYQTQTKAGNNNFFRQRWEHYSGVLVRFSTVPFLALLLPQITKNFRNILADQPQELMVLSWMGYLTALLGNTLMLSYFVAKQESGAATVQTIGALSNLVVLAQLYYVEVMPAEVFWLVMVLQSFMVVISVVRATGKIQDPQKLLAKVYFWWQAALGMLGLVVVPQVLISTLFQTSSVVPMIISSAAIVCLIIMDQLKQLPARLQLAWESISAWTATILFCCTPIVQLVRNFSGANELSGLSQSTILLAMCGNGLMIPRAMYTRDWPWLVGSMCGTFLMGWGQFLSLVLCNCMRVDQFLLVSFLLTMYIILVVWGHSKAG